LSPHIFAIHFLGRFFRTFPFDTGISAMLVFAFCLCTNLFIKLKIIRFDSLTELVYYQINYIL